MEKFKKIADFHIEQYQDKERSGNPQHIVVAASLLQSRIMSYGEYAYTCTANDIAGVSEKTWKEETK